MRIVASVCLVIAVLFMVGCGTSAEDKKMIQDQGAKIQTLEKANTDAAKMAGDMTKKVGEIEAFLKLKFKDYGVPPDTMKKVEPAKKGAPAKTEPAKTEPKPTTPAKKTEPGKTK